MASTAPLVLRLVANSVCIAHRAGRIVREIMTKGDLGIVDKGGKNDFQTEADRSAQRCIIASLHRSFPKVAIFGEEDLETKDISPDWVETTLAEDVMSHAANFPENLRATKDDEICVWVDPLDGTAEYTQGLLDHVTVLIGIAVNGTAVGGVVYQPYFNYEAGPDAKLGRAIWGIIGVGGFGFEPKKAPEGENIITTTRSHGTRAVVEAVEACDPSEIMRVGGAGHKVSYRGAVLKSKPCVGTEIFWGWVTRDSSVRCAGPSHTKPHFPMFLYCPTGSFGMLNRKPPPLNQNIIVTSKWHTSPDVMTAAKACMPTQIQHIGGAGTKVLLVLEGKAHAYVFASPGCKKWDTCAPEAVLHAAGGKLTDIHGNTFQYHPTVQRRNTGGVLACPTPESHQSYLEMIPDSVKETLPPS